MSKLQPRTLIQIALATTALLGSVSAFAADDGCYTVANGVEHCTAQSTRSREAVKSELHNAQAAGQMKRVGELAEAPVSDPVPAVALTRSQVKSELAVARANHQLARVGEM